MITKENLLQVVKSLTINEKKRILNSEKEYVVLYLHVFNVGWYATVRLTNDYNRYKNVSNSGNAILYTYEIRDLIINSLTEKIKSFAKNNKSGFTLDIETLNPIQTGYVASYKATQNSFTETDLQSVINHAINHNCVVGGWFNEKNKRYYFDSNKVFNNIAKAIKFAIENEQLAIFDIDNMHEIRLDKQL